MFSAAFTLGALTLIAALLAGVWLDRMRVLHQTSLFVVFQVISLGAVIAAVSWWCADVQSTWQRLLIVVAAMLAWRVSYFPIMVFSGWIATLFEKLTLPYKNVPIIIYPTYLICLFVMHTIAAVAAGALVTLNWIYLLPITVPAFVMATLVSFTGRADYKLLPDNEVTLNEPLPPGKLPTGNVYQSELEKGGLSIPRFAIIFASTTIYPLIPHSPWSATVKGTLEELFRNMPEASTAIRVRDHYVAYHRAHPLIGSRGEASKTRSAQVVT